MKGADLFDNAPSPALAAMEGVRADHDDGKYDPFDEDEVVPVQYPTAVFVNKGNGVTIMQDQTARYGDRDVIIVLSSRQAVQAVISALQQKLEEM